MAMSDRDHLDLEISEFLASAREARRRLDVEAEELRAAAGAILEGGAWADQVRRVLQDSADPRSNDVGFLLDVIAKEQAIVRDQGVLLGRLRAHHARVAAFEFETWQRAQVLQLASSLVELVATGGAGNRVTQC
jgi:hypothetical protein